MQGKTINGFVLKQFLGAGGMAEVWYAENGIGKPAAVKILNENLSHNEQVVERFHNEALVMVKLNHPNIRQVYDYGYLDHRHCIIMEYLEGDDLEALMKAGRRFTDEELCRWWNQTVDALNYTHAMGIVHRDIKPSNLFLDNKGNIKLLDFGIAKLRESISMTRTGTMMGTLLYMSPEQVQDSKYLDYHSDIYSLAVTFVHLLTGKAPYDITTTNDYAIRKGIVEEPFNLSAIPAEWRGFLQPYLEKDPNKRPALRHFEADKGVSFSKKEESTSEVHDEKVTINQKATEDKPKITETVKSSPSRKKAGENETTRCIKPNTALSVVLGVVIILRVILSLYLKAFQSGIVFVSLANSILGIIFNVLLLVWFAFASKDYKNSKKKAFGGLAMIALSVGVLISFLYLVVRFSHYTFYFGLESEFFYKLMNSMQIISDTLLGISFIIMGKFLARNTKKWSIAVGILIFLPPLFWLLYNFWLFGFNYGFYSPVSTCLVLLHYAVMTVFFFLCAKTKKASLNIENDEA